MIPVDDNKLICHNHLDIIGDCSIIREHMKDANYELALQYIDHLQTCAVRALDQGKRMESRLKKYRNLIGSLGFTRFK